MSDWLSNTRSIRAHRKTLPQEMLDPRGHNENIYSLWIKVGFTMARSKAGRLDTRKLSEAELLASFDQGLSTLAQLAKVYDEGYAPICFLMATEIHKLLTENNAAVKLRGTRTFTTVDYGDDTKMLNAMYKLTGAIVGGDPERVDFVPDFYLSTVAITRQAMNLKFKVWWNDDIIYRASAAVPGTMPPGMIPVNDTPSVPYEKRERMNRRDFIAMLRNKLGAHQSQDMPHLLDELEDARSWSSFSVQTQDRVLSTDDGSLPVGVTNIAAMTRQICHEIIIAYERKDDGPQLTPGQGLDSMRT